AHDPMRARELLAQAGFPGGFATDFYVPTGRYLMDRQLGEAIQAQLAEVGIRASIQAPDWGTFSAIVDAKGRAPMFLLGKGSPTGDLDFTLTLTDATGGKMNDTNLGDPAIDKLIAEQRSILDPARRAAVLKQIQVMIYQQYPYIVLFYEDQLFATRANVHDVGVYANEFVDFSKAWKE
ncbi:MAG: ABC transporter substrate-binding protein, partial [Nevskiales bacterium]